MPYIVIGTERFALPIGDTPIGGTGDETLHIPQLARIPLAAVISVLPDRTATIKRTGRHVVRLDGAEVSEEPRLLSHGARIAIDQHEITFGDIRESGSTVSLPGMEEDPYAQLAGLAQSDATADSGGRLVMRDGTVVGVPAQGLVIGRDPTCDLVVTGKGASRRHATISTTLRGYVVRDESENGTYVNGRRIEGEYSLGIGDVIRIGAEEFQFDADRPDALGMTTSEAAQPTPRKSSAPDMAPSVPGAVGPAPAKGLLLATLEILAGPQKGSIIRIERPVAHIGRAEYNEVRLKDTSVSGSHATLTRRGNGWVVLDLGSTNGTYVDGERINGERRLTGPTELRFGDLKFVFRPIAGTGDDESSTRAVVGVRPPQT